MRNLLVIAAAGLALIACTVVSGVGQPTSSGASPSYFGPQTTSTGTSTAPQSAAACPTDLRISVGPRIYDTTSPRKVPRGGRKDAHPMKAVNLAALPTESDAVAMILAIENKTPGLIPAGFREQVRAAPRDAALRLTMARCELENPLTLHRATQDAALAVLLGADPDVAYQLHKRVSLIDGDLRGSCSSDKECSAFGAGATCDRHEHVCESAASQTSTTLSLPEIEVDEVLSAAFLRRHDPDRDIDRVWAFRATHRCGKTLCRFQKDPVVDPDTFVTKDIIVYWDVNERGGHHETKLSEREKSCVKANPRMNGADLESCNRYCSRGPTHLEGDCIARCAAHCM